MMKKTLCYLLVLILLLTLSACGGRQGDTSSTPVEEAPTTVTTTSTTTTSAPSSSSGTTSTTRPTEHVSTPSSKQSTTSSNSRSDKLTNNCKLIVNGRDISSEHYVHLSEEHRDVVIPLIAVVKELGANVQWQDKTTLVIIYNGDEYILDTAKPAFDLPRPPGSKLFVRKIIDNEVIVDSVSATGLIAWMGAKITINYEERIVEIG